MVNDVALLLIDIQLGFIEVDEPVYQAQEMLSRFKSLLNKARYAGVPVIYLRHDNEPTIDGPIHPKIAPSKHDLVISKQTPNSFFETNLHQQLQLRGIKRLVIAGFQSEMCITATSMRARELGYEIILVEDGHSTFDFEQPAQVIIAERNQTLSEVATLCKAESIKFTHLIQHANQNM